MASPAKRRREYSESLKHFQKETFLRVATTPFSVNELLVPEVSEYLKLMAKSNNTTAEMLMCSLLPTTAACMSPAARLLTGSVGNHSIPGNMYLIGKFCFVCGWVDYCVDTLLRSTESYSLCYFEG